MPLLGAHMSIAGGLHKALERGRAVGCDTIQLFTRPNVAWQANPITEDDARAFDDARRQTGIDLAVAHDCYLINVGSTDPIIYRKSMDALVDEVLRADQLGLPYLVMHPGAHGGRGEEAGLKRIAQSLSEVHRRTPDAEVKILIETTAGMGSALGHTFEQLRDTIEHTKDGDRRLGVCFDTCHTFAAGYDTRTEKGCREVFAHFDRVVGIERLRAFHLNDSKGDLGAHLDRHEHIGRGKLGLAPFRFLLNDPRFAAHPMYLETPKGKKDYWDRRNLATLRALMPPRPGRRRR